MQPIHSLIFLFMNSTGINTVNESTVKRLLPPTLPDKD